MAANSFKYLSPIIIYLLAIASFSCSGWVTWAPMIYAWIMLPSLELFLKPDNRNLSASEENLAKENRWYDFMLYLIVPLQYALLGYFLFSMHQNELQWWETAGRICSMGLLCGTFGINVGHELGHRINRFEQAMAKMLLATSLYMHFFIEHNKGHHKHVATPQDPSSARLNEPVYLFYFRTILYSYISAWKIANEDSLKKNGRKFHFRNEMLQAHIIQLLLLTCIWFLFGSRSTCYFLIAAFIGILLLETVNYIEHYVCSENSRPQENMNGLCHSIAGTAIMYWAASCILN
jgi:alkane 1-monooxygenase